MEPTVKGLQIGPVSGSPGSALDDLAQLAARLVSSSYSQVTLLSEVATIVSSTGMPEGYTGSKGPLADSVCTVTANNSAALIVTDAAKDPRVNFLPPVTSGAVGAYLGVPLHDETGQAVGALCVFDSKPRSWSDADVALVEHLAAAASAHLEMTSLGREYEARHLVFNMAIEAAEIGVFDYDPINNVLTWDDRLREIFDYTRVKRELTIEDFNGRLHSEDLPVVGGALQHAIDTVGEFDSEYRVVLANGETRWVSARGRALADESGKTVRFLGAAFDVTERREAMERAATAAKRAALLGAVASLLSDTLDAELSLPSLPVLLVPELSDGCTLALLDGQQISWHRGLTAGDAAFRSEYTLVSGGRTLGLLTVLNDSRRGDFTADNRSTLQEIANQVGLALDNARLYAEQRDLSEELQRSLLTDLPQPEHLQLAVRYQSATQGIHVGGDWYDAFVNRDGKTSIVIGDVAGHDRDAAVVMAQVRNILRGVGYAMSDKPSSVLSVLDGALRDLTVSGIMTSIVATIEQTEDNYKNLTRTMRWSNAGHPPPLLLKTNGEADILMRPADVLLGAGSTKERTDHSVTLEPGYTVVLYTDGLIEKRGESLMTSFERLKEAAVKLAELPLEDFCDALLEELASDASDDVALLALRTYAEDKPRPADAGPTVLPGEIAGRQAL